MGWVVILGVAFLMAVGGLFWAFWNTVFMIGHALSIPDVIVTIGMAFVLCLITYGIIVLIHRRPATNI